jgi:hypothetical protein
MTQDRPIPAPASERRDNSDRRSEHRSDRRAHDRYMPVGSALRDRRQGERRRHAH